ncbi:MAG: hypothetical protein EPN76_14765 [Burkholderiaceae bacterium]|nr:MAG: hypothetical protein EPN76_14765 [Burkholderiaceae bacterium]
MMANEEQKRSLNHIHPVQELEWEPWELYFRGVPACEGKYGGWVKVLHRPNEYERGWTFLFKWVGWPGKTLRLIAIVPDDSNEQVYYFSEQKSATDAIENATYVYRAPGAKHSGTFGDDFLCVLSFAGETDVGLSYEFLDR